MADDDITIRLKLRGARETNRELRKTTREVDDLGDEVKETNRQMGLWQDAQGRWRQENGRFATSLQKVAAGIDEETKATERLGRSRRKLLGGRGRGGANTRINLGPVSFSPRQGALALGALALATERYAGSIISVAEAGATVGAGALAGGGAIYVAAAQGVSVLTLALGDLGDALGGNEEALKRLGPEAREAFDLFSGARDKLKGTASAGLLPGLLGGGKAATANLPVIDKITNDTAKALGRLAQAGGDMVGSKGFGRDLAKIGGRNVDIIENLGHAGLDLGSAVRHVLVEAGPLAVWLSELARRGARLTDVWVENKRATGELGDFFARARDDMAFLGRGTAAGGRGLVNLFGAHDVDGTRTLANFERLMVRFEAWSNSPAVRRGVGQAIVDEIPQLAGPLATAMGHLFFDASGKAAGLFWDGFWGASAEGKMWLGAAVLWKSGAFKRLGGLLSGGLLGGGSVPTVGFGKGRVVPVLVTNPGWGGPGGPTSKPTKPGNRVRVPRVPAWLPRAGGPLAAVGAGLTVAELLAKTGPPGGVTPESPEERARRRNTPGNDPFAIGRLPQRAVGRGNPHPLDPGSAFEPLQINLHIDGREIHREVVRIERDGAARRGGAPQGMQTF